MPKKPNPDISISAQPVSEDKEPNQTYVVVCKWTCQDVAITVGAVPTGLAYLGTSTFAGGGVRATRGYFVR